MRWGSRWRFGRWIPVGCCARCCLWDRMPSLRTALIRSVSGFGKNNTRKQENDLQIAGPLPRLRIFEWPVYLHGSFLCVEWFWERPSQSSGGRGGLWEEPLQSQPVGCASFPEGDALGKEGRSRPHSSTAGRSQPISGKLSAFAKASPFRERWHGEAVTERVSPETNPFRHFALRNATSPEGNSRPHRSTVKKSLPPYPLLTSPLCPAMMVSYQTVDGLNSWPAKQMGEKQDEREIQKKL